MNSNLVFGNNPLRLSLLARHSGISQCRIGWRNRSGIALGRQGRTRLLLLFLFFGISTSALAESIISRSEADHIFNLDRAGWEAYARQIGVPTGWDINFKPVGTGTKLVAVDPVRGIVLSMQPFYDNDNGPPGMLIVGSNYPLGTYPEFTEARKRDLETEVSEDLGSKYSVLIAFKKTKLIEGFDIIVTRE